MIKVFLVEDESLVREGIRDCIQWEQLGFEFAGEATDGELALPLIRKIKPDVLITDIKMPFMDGLDLGRFVSKELPQTKIIIISGYDDFEYARQAIELHVDKYLLKPITKAALTETLKNVKEQIEAEQEQSDYLHKFNKEVQEYEQYSRRKLFEEMVLGGAPVHEIYAKAEKLEIDLVAENYNIVMFIPQVQGTKGNEAEEFLQIHEALMQTLTGDSRYMVVRWNMITFAICIKATAARMDEATRHCIEVIKQQCENGAQPLEWYVAAGTPVNRLSGLPGCFSQVNHIMSFRHLFPKEHILEEKLLIKEKHEEQEQVDTFDVAMVDPALIRSFLQTGLSEEISDIIKEFMTNLSGAIKSMMFRNYLVLNVRYLSAIFVKGLGYDYDTFLNELPAIGMEISVEKMEEYIADVLKKALSIRDSEAQKKSKNVLDDALKYIDENYADENISLISVANYVNISPNYFSAIFSQEIGLTFVEYLTKKRIENAK